jgi:hypothetical protein
MCRSFFDVELTKVYMDKRVTPTLTAAHNIRASSPCRVLMGGIAAWPMS